MDQALIENGQHQSIPMNKNVSRDIRIGFVRKVYGILSVQLTLTCAIAYPMMQLSPAWVMAHLALVYAVMALQVVCMCAISCCHSALRVYPQNYAFLFLFTATEGFLMGLVCAGYSAQSVGMAASSTALIFVFMTAYAFTTKSDFTGFGPYLVAALFVVFNLMMLMMILQLAGVHSRPLELASGGLGVLVFTFFIVYDTQKMIGEWGGHKVQFNIDDYCFAALNLYLDIINLFLQLLQMFGDKK